MAIRVSYNKGLRLSPVAFMFACPGQKEQSAGMVVAGNTGKNLDRLLASVSCSQHKKIRDLFPSSNRYDYLITNASDIVHYKAHDGRSLPSKSEYMAEENIERLYNEFRGVSYVITFGDQAKDVSSAVAELFEEKSDERKPIFITSLRHLSFLSLNQISQDVNGAPIAKGDKEGTQKRIEVMRKRLEDEIADCLL